MPSPPQFSSARQARRDFGARLDALRKQADLSAHALAVTCGWSDSKVSRIRRGLTAPSADDVRAWALACDAVGQVDDLLATLADVEGMFIEWRRMETTGLRRAQESVLPLWERTRRFRAYSSWILPGIAQTADYTRTLLTSFVERRSIPDDVDEAVQARVERQRFLYEGRRTFALLIEEHVLRTIVGGPSVMAGQLGHLLTVGSLPSVSLGVIPADANRSRMWPVEAFWIFDDAQVNAELISGWLTITQPSEVAMYADAYVRLAEPAVYGSAARRLITAAIDALE